MIMGHIVLETEQQQGPLLLILLHLLHRHVDDAKCQGLRQQVGHPGRTVARLRAAGHGPANRRLQERHDKHLHELKVMGAAHLNIFLLVVIQVMPYGLLRHGQGVDHLVASTDAVGAEECPRPQEREAADAALRDHHLVARLQFRVAVREPLGLAVGLAGDAHDLRCAPGTGEHRLGAAEVTLLHDRGQAREDPGVLANVQAGQRLGHFKLVHRQPDALDVVLRRLVGLQLQDLREASPHLHAVLKTKEQRAADL
mmetsp:Transcript_33878/g.96881  ORF Transcript_33878/g.96881 Transcript_33878/m.96881 type:complete len:255 (-) Transcript_33878:1419-2183(-)